jgi:hypothetical protein
MTANAAADDTPEPKFFREKIGDKEYALREVKLDVLDDVMLWPDNPRLIPFVTDGSEMPSQDDLENHLRQSKGYDVLAKSIADLGQMEPIYVWKRKDQAKYLVFEGATRVTILRAIARKYAGDPNELQHREVIAKVLPADFTDKERAILLARIHVRGTGVRSWGRYIEARFVYQTVVGLGGKPPLMTPAQLAENMGKSQSWVSRLKDAYAFAQKFVDHVDIDNGDKDEDAKQLASKYFSTLEEIAKAPNIGTKLREYDNPAHDALRADVFDMVKKKVFKEYRDARFMREYYDDPEKWEQLKQGQEGIANELAAQIKANSSSLRARIEALPGQLERALEKDREALDDEGIETLRKAVQVAESYCRDPGVNRFRIVMSGFTEALQSVTLADIKAVQRKDVEAFEEALADFRARLDKYKSWT